ncbi:hypothetical protein J0A67_04835 [Algoriphagus aestuariicola]|uniref:Glycosyltransferase RgtA/B/C/D-like domain-containing protein n=1 Tax=Algoriphagus aestuariicola TaxID=1852016 RepID=A0ABS3BLI8_9BACT|nr:hypothetical protein [Algoriphagus aestuariicola]MBN7800173.1 hypothetical protein [Algoriphagus aestuariicola]
MKLVVLIALLALIAYLQINGERIPVHEGAYGDGVFYRDVGRFFLDDIETSSYNLVQLTRILPFALLNLSFSAFHIVKDDEGLGNGMLIWQLIYLALAVYWYVKITRKLRLKAAPATLGFVLFFFNFAWLKSVWFHPFSPDLLAFALGMGQMNYYLRYEKFKLGMVSILGTFVSPLLLVSGLLMLFLPGDKLPVYEEERPKSLLPVQVSFFSVIILAVLGWVFWGWSELPLLQQSVHALALLALPCLIIYVAINNPIHWDHAISQIRKKTRSARLSRGIMGFTGILLILVMLSGNNQSLGILRFLTDLGIGVFRFPMDFVLSTTLHWGIICLLTLVFIKRFLQELGNLGGAIVLVLLMGAVFLPFFKAPAMAAWIPIWGVVLLKALKRYRWTEREQYGYAALALLLSLCWLPLNSNALTEFLNGGSSQLLDTWAVQKWAIHHPQYTSLPSYALVFILLAATTYWIYRRRKKYVKMLTN